MTYLEMKKSVKRAFLKQLTDLKGQGKRPHVNTNVLCEFCMVDKKRWEVKLVNKEGAEKINDPFLLGVLEKSKFIMACNPCIDKHELEPLQNAIGAKWDGESEILEKVIGGVK